jgi:hypothetical protein
MCAERSERGVDSRIAELAGRQHGVVSRDQLLEFGYSPSDIKRRLRRTALLGIHRGVYAVGHRSLTQEGRWLAAVLAAGRDAVLSHRSAGQLWGLLPWSGSIPEITRPTASRLGAGIRAHRSALPDDEKEATRGIPVTSVSRTLLDMGGVLGRTRIEQALNEAEIRRLTSAVSIPALLARYPRRPGTANLRALLEQGREAAGITRRELEASFADFVDVRGLPRPRRNAYLLVRDRTIEVDCLWPLQRLIVELDGRAVHSTMHAFEGDRERDRLLTVEGWDVIRVTWHQLEREPDALAADLAGLLAAGQAS